MIPEDYHSLSAPPKVLIGILANDAARYSLFGACVTKLDRTEYQSQVEWLIGGDWCSARNDLVRMTLDGDYTHLWFMDDDHAFSASLLKMLLRHDKALVMPLCLARVAPFPLVTYAGMLEDGSRYLPLDLAAGGETGLVELAAGGCAGMLIRRDVLEALSDPWFEHTDRSEDILFCEKAKAAKFTLYADLEARLGHITTAVVWPAVNEGTWMTGLTIGHDLNLFVSLASEWEEEPADDVDGVPPSPVDGDPPTSGSSSLPDVERVEIWFVPDENRWHARTLNFEGEITHIFDAPQEQPLLDHCASAWPDAEIHHIESELYDSRGLTRYGPPPRLWNREVKQ